MSKPISLMALVVVVFGCAHSGAARQTVDVKPHTPLNVSGLVDPEAPWVTLPAPPTPSGTVPSAETQSTTRPDRCREATTIPGLVLFDSTSAKLTTQALTALQQTVTDLCITPLSQITVYGHTDGQGSEQDNLDLSQRRAETCADWLRGQGFTEVSAVGAGEGQPIADNETSRGRELNRRVVIVVVNR